MKLYKITLALILAIGTAQAEYQMQIKLDSKDIRFVNPTDASSIVGQWQNYGDIYGCSNWSPDPSSITISTQFIQTATDCKQNQIRTVQDRVLDTVSGKIVNKGNEYTQQQTLTNQSQTRNYTVYLSEWTNIGQLTDCTNWGPDPSTVNNGESFIQTATDCKQEQTRSRVEGYIDNKTGYSVEVLSENESIVLSGQSSTRTAIGTKVSKVCSYVANYTTVFTFGFDYFYSWDNVHIGTSLNNQIISGGYVYTVGSLKSKEVSYITTTYYEICREPI